MRPHQAPLFSPTEIGRQVAPLLDGSPVSGTTVSRWIAVGIKLSSGERLHLRALRMPCGFRVALDDVQAFLSELTRDRVAGRVAGSGRPRHEEMLQASR